MAYVTPVEMVAQALQAAEKKANLHVGHMLVRGLLAGGFLGYATSLVMVILAQGLPPIAGAAAFPVGFVILVLLGLELVVGNFALLPMTVTAGRVRLRGLIRSWSWVYVGNLLGSVLYAMLFYLAISNFGITDGGEVGSHARRFAEAKTLGYAAIGFSGWGTAFLKGILCSWMLTLGAVLAFASRSTAGKVIAMWLPVMIFFAHGYENSVVNMYAIPVAMLLGSQISIADWWFWNLIPVTLGNMIGGAIFTGLALYFTHRSPH